MADEEEKPERQRGLKAVAEARESRGKLRWPAPRFWAWTALVLAASAILHWKWSQGQVESARQQLMARQRGVAAELGPRWFPLRDTIEGWTTSLAKDAVVELVDREAVAGWDFRDKPGIYLRLRTDQAKAVDGIRKEAKTSLRDAFTACLTRAPNPNPLAGKECKKTRDCPQGEFCNELDHCARPAQPYNLRVAYKTLYVLSEEWVRDAQEADNELRLRLLRAGFDDTISDDVPVAADLLTRAQYYLVVLDEPTEGLALDKAEATEALLAQPHWARIGLFRLSDRKPILRLRREASGQLIGATGNVEPDTMDARQRQANSCALALSVREAIGDTSAAAVPPLQ